MTAVLRELAEARTTADEMTRAVKRLVVERDYAIAEAAELATMLEDVRAEARGARSDYEELKGFNADLADERDRYKAVINAAKSWREWIAASPVRTQDAGRVESALMDAVDALCGDCPEGCPGLRAVGCLHRGVRLMTARTGQAGRIQQIAEGRPGGGKGGKPGTEAAE